MYVCPDCKTPLVGLGCPGCAVEFSTSAAGIPLLLSRDQKLQMAHTISAAYDDIYARRSKVWEDQGRTPEFITYFSNLAASFSTDRILEIGCGEGFLLSALRASSKTAVDISPEALQKAKQRSHAQCAVALAERLPFPDDTFDLAVSVGVMEHFLNDREATTEIARVLRTGGRYLALLHVSLTRSQEAAQKIREYIFPRFRPLPLLRWLRSKVVKPIHQPIQREYTPASAAACLKQSGLSIDHVISLHTSPTAPLVGPHVLIYVACK